MFIIQANLTLRDVTIYDNGADPGPAGAGGIEWTGLASSVTITVRNSIVAGNRRGSPFTGEASDCHPAITSNGSNFIGSNLNCTIENQNNDQIGTGDAPLDPRLGTLDFHGGPTQNHVPHTMSPASPVIDAGSGCFNVDQRGRTRPRDGNGNNVSQCDIGAVEWQPGVDPGRGVEGSAGLRGAADKVD
ncbi:MAG: choice-of-anchor Q domain-containing protein [Nitrospiraceae bacterium]